jgi:(1->4)-alpha-D-glucan 1-alpha-D-glucosylmutase
LECLSRNFTRAVTAAEKRIRTAMLAASTHDTKRSEDVRARIAAISELAGTWVRNVRHWKRKNADKKAKVDDETGALRQ